VRRRMMRAPTQITVREAAVEWLQAAEARLVRTRSGSPYKPSALRSYREALRTKLLPELGQLRLSSVSRNCVQDLADRMVGEGFAPSSVRNAILPLRAIYRRAIDRGEVAVNPTLKLSLPALKPMAASRHISDPNVGGGARVAPATREEGPINSGTTEEVER